MAGVRTGLDFLRGQREKFGGGGSGSKLLKLWLKSGERAAFWFITDGENAAVPLIHLVPKKRKDGSSWTKDVLCAREDLDDNTFCQLCADDVPGPWPRLVVLVYVTAVYHSSQNSDNTWTPVKGGGDILYKEDVNALRLLIAKQRLQQQIEDEYAGDPTDVDFTTRTRTLLDRPFQLVRTGSGQQTSEVLKAGSKQDMPEAVLSAMREAGSLADIVKSEFGDSSQGPARPQGRAEGFTPVVEAEVASDAELEDF